MISVVINRIITLYLESLIRHCTVELYVDFWRYYSPVIFSKSIMTGKQ